MDELKEIKKQVAKLTRKAARLEAKATKVGPSDNKLDDVVKNSGYKTPRALVKALIQAYGVKLVADSSGSVDIKRRKRTRVTIELRDSVKKEVSGGMSMNAASKQFNISYAVVTKIMKGDYDKLG